MPQLHAMAIPLIDAPYAPEWWATASASLLIGAFFIAGYFMAGEFFQNAQAKSLAKHETYELAVSIILIMTVVGLMYAWGVISSELSQSTLAPGGQRILVSGTCQESEKIYPTTGARGRDHPENVMYASADWFLGCQPGGRQNLQNYDHQKNQSVYAPLGRGIMLTEMMNQYFSLLSLEMILGPISTFGVSAFLPEATLSHFDVSMAPNAGLGPISEALIVVTDLIGVGIGAIIMQKLLLVFIHQNVLVVFLPLGLACRGVPFLRKTGSTIIAMCLVLYFIYPLSIWINQQIYFSIENKLINWANYASLAEICQIAAGQSSSNLQTRIGDGYEDYTRAGESAGRELAGGGGGGRILPWGWLQSLWNSFRSAFGTVAEYMILYPFAWLTGPVLPVNFFFEALVDMITVSMQIFVLNLLFLVSSILMCVTVFKDLSLAIGGEPRIFGMSKLV